jgi:WD40 repeat protein
MNSQKRSKQPLCEGVHLPTSVISDHILPFTDRSTWNRLILANREIYKASQKIQAPWPSGEFEVLGGHAITRVQFSSDGNLLCCSCDDNRIRIYHKEKGPYATIDFRIIDGPDSTITGMQCSPVENMLVVLLAHCNHHSVCRFLDLHTLEVRNEILFPDNLPRSDCKVSPDGKLVAFQRSFQSPTNTIHLQVYNISPAEEAVLIKQFSFSYPDRILFDFDPDSRHIAVLHGSGIRFFDIYGYIVFNGFHPDGDELVEAQKLLSIPRETSFAVLTKGGTIFRLGSGYQNKNLVIHSEARFLGISLSSSGRLLATRSADNFIEIWDPINNEDLPITRVHILVNKFPGSAWKTWLDFTSSPDGQQLAINVGDSGFNCLGIWDVDL